MAVLEAPGFDMKRSPIQAGDKAIVIHGFIPQSPNVGKTVVVKTKQGERSQYGVIWRCEGEGVSQVDDSGQAVAVGWADFPAIWLQKIDPLTGLTEPMEEVNHLVENTSWA